MTAGTAPVINRRTPGEDIAARAHAVLHAALAVADLWGGQAEAVLACWDLVAALDEHGSLEAGTVHWEQAYPELSDAEDPHAEALDKSAEECALAMTLLLMTIAAHCGTGIADGIKAVAVAAS